MPRIASSIACPPFISLLIVCGLAIPLHGESVVDVARHSWAAPSFGNDVIPVLSKAGCNAGTCHGNKNGKGEFKLSLRGENPGFDYESLVGALRGRRINRAAPDRSLMLLKPTSQVPHEGGHRFDVDSPEYDVLRRWIAAGAPRSRPGEPRLVSLDISPRHRVVMAPHNDVHLKLYATFSDGTARDVTRWAVYETSNLNATVSVDGKVHCEDYGETTVIARFLNQHVPARIAFLPRRDDFEWTEPAQNNYIDQHVWAKLQRLRMQPSESCDDATFVRRAYLDALGILPTAREARLFVASTEPGKRTQLIDQLLDRPEFTERWALLWSDLLRNEEKLLDAKGVDVFFAWLKQSFAQGKPLDEMVQQLITAQGSTYENPPANYWRALRNPVSRAETTAQVFLGVRLKCAQCHNHPFDRWTQDDYYSWAGLFARIDYEIVENKRKDKLDKHEFKGEQIVKIKEKGEVKNARTGKNALPQFLAAKTTPNITDRISADRLAALADWMTSSENELFAEMQANRIWAHIMGRGIVEPIDDFRDTNPPINPELLNALTDDFVEHGFDVKHLVRRIMNSRTYQLSSLPKATNERDEQNFARSIVRRLPAELLLDAQCQVLDVPAKFNGHDEPVRAGQLAGVQRVRPRDKRPSAGDRFLKVFGKPQRLLSCECERSNETTLSQALVLLGGEGLNRRLLQEGNRLTDLTQSDLNHRQIVEQLYWTALSRPPTENEIDACLRTLRKADDSRQAFEDITWALINSKEFIYRH